MRLSLAVCLALMLTDRNAAGADLADLRGARSIVAEAALVLRLDAQHRLTARYAGQSQKIIRDQLQSELQSLGPGSHEGQLVRAGLAALQARSPGQLDKIQQELSRLVDQRE